MPSNLVSRVLGVALIGLVFSSRAHGSMHALTNDVYCPKDSFVHNAYTYIAPLQNITKLFFDISWYGDTIVNNTTGTNNIPDATRSGPYAGGTYSETLPQYYHYQRTDALVFSYHGQPFSLETSQGVAFRFGGYSKTMRFESICGGKATYIDVLTYIYSDNQIATYASWYTLHVSSFPAMVAKLRAPVLAEDCPQESRCYKD